MSQPETIVRRAAAPKVTASSFAPASPNQETFLNDLKLNMALEEAAQGNVYFTGYIFSNENNYNTIADLARTWQNTPTGQAKYEAQQELTKKLDEMLDSGDAELVIPKDSRTVGGSASANDTTASYTFVPDGNGFTLTPDHAKQYLLPAVRVMPTDGTTASNWFYFLQDAAKAQLPAITLDSPVDAAEPERALGNAVYTQEVNLYNDPEFKSNRGTAPLELRRFTVEWTAVNKYTQAEGTVRNLTDSYTFTVTPLDSKTKQPYSITVTTYDRDVKDEDGNVTHKRGEIETVTKTYNDITTPLDKQTTVVDAETKETRIWYDLSVEPVTDENGNVTWKSQPYDVTGTVEKDGGTLYYKAQTVPMLELVQAMRDGLCDHPEAERLMQELAVQLGAVKGKKSYGYLSKPVKKTVDEVVDKLEELQVVRACYDQWCRFQGEVESCYHDKPREKKSCPRRRSSGRSRTPSFRRRNAFGWRRSPSRMMTWLSAMSRNRCRASLCLLGTTANHPGRALSSERSERCGRGIGTAGGTE